MPDPNDTVTLESTVVHGSVVHEPPSRSGPPNYGGIGGFGGGRGGGGGGVNGPFEPNPGENEVVKDASVGDGPCSPQKDASGSNPSKGNPIVLSTGNKVETEVDFTSTGEMPLQLVRTYDHYWKYPGLFGKYWVSNLDYSLVVAQDESTIFAQRPDGRRIKFKRDPGNANLWLEDKPNPIAKIQRTVATPPATPYYTLSTEDNVTEVYDAEGRVLRRTNVNGISWRFGYENRFLKTVTHISGRLNGSPLDRTITLNWDETHGKLLSVVAPDASVYTYSYTADAFGAGLHRLASVTTPDAAGNPSVTTTYHYDDPRFPGGLTGKSFNGVRYSTFAYDASARATDSKHTGPLAGTFVDAYHFNYTGAMSNPPGGGPADPPGPGVVCDPVTHYCPHPQFAPEDGSDTSALEQATDAAEAEEAVVSMIPAATNTVIETNPLGLQTTYTFVDGKLTATSGAASAHCGARSSSRTYDANGFDDQVVDFNGNVTDYNYAANGRIGQKIEALGSAVARTTTYVWDVTSPRNRILSFTVAGLNQTTYTYSPENRIASVAVKNISANGVNGMTRTITYAYTRWGVSPVLKTMAVDGPLTDDTVTTTFSEDGDVLTVVSPTGTTTYSGYDGFGHPSRVVGENGETVDYAYYPGGALKSVTTYPNGSTPATTTYTYASGLLQTVTGPDGVSQNYFYDAARRLTSTTRSVIGGTASHLIAYDASSNPTLIRDALSGNVKKSITIDYDELDRVRARRGNNNENYTYTYDDNGNLLTSADSYGHTTSYNYDALDRISSSTNAQFGVTSYTYDAANQPKSVTDPRNATTTYKYDGIGLLWSEVSSDRGTMTYSNSTVTALLTSLTRNGITTTFGYDGSGRLLRRAAVGQEETFTYDTCLNGIGRLCTATSPTTSVSYAYEPDGRIRSRSDQITVAGSTSSSSTSYLYDAIGRLSRLTYPNGQYATYGYTTGQASSLTMSTGGSVVSSASYEPFGPLSYYVHGNGLVRDFAFDTNGRYTTISSKNGSTPLQSLSYGYDNDDRILAITSNFGNTFGESYGYDELSHLTTATGNGVTYDSNDNRLSLSPNGSVYVYYPNTNRLKNISNPFFPSDGVDSTSAPEYNSNIGYDLVGNITSWDFPSIGYTAIYGYDPFNRMKSTSSAASLGGVQTLLGDYGYNAFGERTGKRDITHGHNYAFIYGEGHQLLADRVDGSQWTNYLWFGGQLVGMTRGGALYQIDNDHLGRPELITNASKAIVWRSNNGPFGARTIDINSLSGDFNVGFPGQYFDAESNLWYNMNRYYVAELGRYLQPDPIGFDGDVNPYAYVRGNPSNRVDPLGLWSFSFDAYAGLGGSIVFGQDPLTNQWFYGGRIGFGFGGGPSFDYKGKRPGGGQSAECDTGTTFGVFIQAGASLGPYQANPVDAHGGYDTTTGSGYSEGPQGSGMTFGNGGGLELSGAFGLEIIGH